MPIVNIELNDTELNKIKTKVLETISHDIDNIVKNSVINITKDKASAYLLKQITPKINEYIEKVSTITRETGIEGKIEKMAKRAVFKAIKEIHVSEIELEARKYAKDHVSSIELNSIMSEKMKSYLEEYLYRNVYSLKTELTDIIRKMDYRVDMIHQNQDYLAKKIGIIPNE